MESIIQVDLIPGYNANLTQTYSVHLHCADEEGVPDPKS